jgi:hypothetical protein
MSSDKKWKTGLLKSGLPLEYVTARTLSELGYHMLGEYPYMRSAESGGEKEFSVDIRAHKLFQDGERLHALNLLIECKYRQLGTSWIFAESLADFHAVGLVQTTEDLLPIRFNSDELYKFEERIGYCVTGIELGADGAGIRDKLMHGVYQLRYAMPRLFLSECGSAVGNFWLDIPVVGMLCPILVTTAELRVLKPGLSLQHFQDAAELDDVSERKDAVILNEQSGPHLQSFADTLADAFLSANPTLENRLRALAKVLVGPEWQSRRAPDLESVRRSFGHTAERVLIVRHETLPKVLSEFDTAVRGHLAQQKIYGSIAQVGAGLRVVGLDGVQYSIQG